METPPDNVFTIPAIRWHQIQEKLAKLQKRARRLSQAPVAATIVREFEIKELVGYNSLGEPVYRTRAYVTVEVQGTAPHVPGYELLGVIGHFDTGPNVFRSAPGQRISEDYREAPARCDHCDTTRRRKDTFLLRETATGAHRQIGRNCLADYLTEKDAAAVTSYLDCCAAWAAAVEEGIAGGDGGGGDTDHTDLLDYLAAVAAAIRVDGWCPRSKDRDAATATFAWRVLFPSKKDQQQRDFPRMTPDDMEAAQKAIAWIRDLPAEQRGSEYIANLHAACSRDYFRGRDDGLVASLVGAAFPRAVRKHAEAAARPESQHVGEPKQRLRDVPVTLEKVTGWEGQWGYTTLVKMRDATGNLLGWYASGSPDVPDEGTQAMVTGTIKKHGTDRYTGQPMTVLTRCKIAAAE